MSFLSFIFGDPSDKKLKKYQKHLENIRPIEAKYATQIHTLQDVHAQTMYFRGLFAGLDIDTPEDKTRIYQILADIQLEAFALHRRTCQIISGQEFPMQNGTTYRWDMVPYDVQIVGAMCLIDGNISEMRTGEGKTLVATIAAYLGALVGIPVHIVTVNDYLARRDAMEMGIIYNALGLTVGTIVHGQDPDTKKSMYACDVVYATNNELGFDYLRDNMAISTQRQSVGKKFFAIIDEVDSILIDEARTPLIISAPDNEPTTKYIKFAAMAKNLVPTTDYKIDEKQRTATLTEAGIQKIEGYLGVENIYISDHYNDLHHVENALKAQSVYTRDVEYLVRGQEVMIIDEHTGRVLSGRRYSDGLHQAIEAKEGVEIQQESRTLASVTFQNYFRLYHKLSGMTGTAKTEEEEFYKIYRLEVISIPTNRPIRRIDRGDVLFRTEKGKYEYIVRLIRTLHEKGQPILVGTVSVAKSEYLSSLLAAENIPHEVLNAKQDAREADIIAGAGMYGAITIATNMAGRGTDIKIDEKVRTLSGTVCIEGAAGTQEYVLGGLFVLGTEKHETRRIDNQLRGRSGRQGDPGISQFMVSPTDDIMRIFGGNKLFGILAGFESHPEGDPLIESKMLMRNIITIQKQVEGRNFDVRKHILEYDDVMNHHRLAIYSRRAAILGYVSGDTLYADTSSIDTDAVGIQIPKNPIHTRVVDMIDEQVAQILQGVSYIEIIDEPNILLDAIRNLTGVDILQPVDISECTDIQEIHTLVCTRLVAHIEHIRDSSGQIESFYEYERRLMLSTIDELWMHHMDGMAHLREEVAFDGYAQKNPLMTYKEKAYEKFITMIHTTAHRVIRGVCTAQHIAADTAQIQTESTRLADYAAHATAGFAPDSTYAPGSIAHTPQGIPDSVDTDDGIRAVRTVRTSSQNTPQNTLPQYTGTGRNDMCPCGSGKKYKQCHGK